MATIVETPSITSAKERAASILYGHEKVTPAASETVSEPTVTAPVETAPQSMPLSTYAQPASATHETDTTLRPYAPIRSSILADDIQMGDPYVNPIDQLITEVTTDTTTAATTDTATTTMAEIDTELEADTQYVVKFKKSTLVAAAALATVFLLMAVLFIVNIVNIAGASAQINDLVREEQVLDQQLNQAIKEGDQYRQQAATDTGTSYTRHYEHYDINPYTAPAAEAENGGGFFDWLCKSLSALFS